MTKLTKEELLARTAAEDALPIEQLTPEQKARRQTRDRKRTQRANEKEQKAVEAELADLSKFQNCHEWWAASRNRQAGDFRRTRMRKPTQKIFPRV